MKNNCAVTIGFFDGVHRGHHYLLGQLEEFASAKGLTPVAVTFDRHPRTVTKENDIPSLLTTQDEKLSLLSVSFSGEIIVLPFTLELSTLSAKEFMRSVLREELGTKFLLMGYNHQFGHGGGTVEDYISWGKETGIEVCFANAFDGEKISSSRIRSLLTLGDIKKANSLLGYPYFLSGNVVAGRQIGREIGFPTANLLVEEHKLLPACGVFAVRISLPDGTEQDGMLSIGHRPTIEEGGEISVEVHIFNFSGNLYGKTISVHFIDKLRNEQHFPSLDALKQQLLYDAASAKEILSNNR